MNRLAKEKQMRSAECGVPVGVQMASAGTLKQCLSWFLTKDIIPGCTVSFISISVLMPQDCPADAGLAILQRNFKLLAQCVCYLF